MSFDHAQNTAFQLFRDDITDSWVTPIIKSFFKRGYSFIAIVIDIADEVVCCLYRPTHLKPSIRQCFVRTIWHTHLLYRTFISELFEWSNSNLSGLPSRYNEPWHCDNVLYLLNMKPIRATYPWSIFEKCQFGRGKILVMPTCKE